MLPKHLVFKLGNADLGSTRCVVKATITRKFSYESNISSAEADVGPQPHLI